MNRTILESQTTRQPNTQDTIRRNPRRSGGIVGNFAACLLAFAFAATPARAVVSSNMITPAGGGSSATVQITITITTSLGTSSSTDTKTMATTGAAMSAFMPNTPPFAATQANAMQINFANTTYMFHFFCIGPFCAVNFNVAVSDLQFMQVQAACSPIGAGGAIAISNVMLHTTGSYVVSGSFSQSGTIDTTGAGSFNGRITNPTSSTVKLDQVIVADQTYVVPPEQLPSGVSAMTIVIHPTLTNTTFSGRFAPDANTYDADNDGVFDACDPCTDTDHDGFGDPGFPWNTCGVDSCPSVYNPDQLDFNSNGVGDACECPADVATPHNGVVNIDDLLAVINAWGATGQGLPADATHDGLINIDDLLAVINGWGACP